MKIPRSLKISDILTILIMFFAISTLFQGLIPFSMNRIIITAILIVVVIYSLKHLKKTSFFVYIYLLFLLAQNLIFSTETGLAIKDLIYFGTTLCMLDYLSSSKVDELACSFNRLLPFIKNIVYVIYFITIISLVLPANYSHTWGEGTYFIGFARDTHVMAASLCLLMALLLLVFAKEKFTNKRAIMLLSVLFLIFETGARTYIVPACVIIYIYIRGNLRGQGKRIILFSLAIIAVGFIFFKSGMYEKFMWSADASNQYAANSLISSTGGRSAFWLIDIREFFRINPLLKLLGCGFDYVYQVNYKYYHMHIWAHNDIIDLLLSTGIVGTFYYIAKWRKFLSSAKGSNRITNFIYVFYVVFPMIFNGVFTYQHYFMSVIVMMVIMREKITIKTTN